MKMNEISESIEVTLPLNIYTSRSHCQCPPSHVRPYILLPTVILETFYVRKIKEACHENTSMI